MLAMVMLMNRGSGIVCGAKRKTHLCVVKCSRGGMIPLTCINSAPVKCCNTKVGRTCFSSVASRRDVLQSASFFLTSGLCSSHAAAAAKKSYDHSEITFKIGSNASVGELESSLVELDAVGRERLAYRPEGWNTWLWKGHRINWLSAGNSGPIVLLIHGFGASSYHFRYTIPSLAKECRVYALDCLGFGLSDKAVVDYEGYKVWTEQISDFIREIVYSNLNPGESSKDAKVIMVGNSLGGYNSMSVAALHPELVKGVVLLNAAGRFDESATWEPAETAADAASEASNSPLTGIIEKASEAVKRSIVGASFLYTKQPARVKQVLGQVYVKDENIDDDLVKSILEPAQDPNAGEVFYRVITARGTPVNLLLQKMQEKSMPLFLLWGEKDPWCVPARADQIQSAYPFADRLNIDSGHCPHDDTPELVNGPLLNWVKSI